MIPFIVNHLLDELKFKPPILHHVHFPRNGLGWEMINVLQLYPSPPRLHHWLSEFRLVLGSGRTVEGGEAGAGRGSGQWFSTLTSSMWRIHNIRKRRLLLVDTLNGHLMKIMKITSLSMSKLKNHIVEHFLQLLISQEFTSTKENDNPFVKSPRCPKLMFPIVTAL